MKILKPRKLRFLLREVKRLLKNVWLLKRSSNKHLQCCTNSVYYSARFVFCMLPSHCMLLLHLRFKYNELIFKEITNHSYKCMVIIISQLEKKIVLFESLLDYNVYHTTDIENFGTYVLIKYRLNDLNQYSYKLY